jgi:hypothetical protein
MYALYLAIAEGGLCSVHGQQIHLQPPVISVTQLGQS